MDLGKGSATILMTVSQQFFQSASLQKNVGRQQYNSSHSLSRANVWQQWLQRLAAFRFQKLIYKRKTVRTICLTSPRKTVRTVELSISNIEVHGPILKELLMNSHRNCLVAHGWQILLERTETATCVSGISRIVLDDNGKLS